MSPSSSESKNNPSKKPALKKMAVTFNGLYGLIFQKTELFITTGVKSSNPTTKLLDLLHHIV
jgi:hypothetical protein